MSEDEDDFDEVLYELENDFIKNDNNSNVNKSNTDYIECLQKNFGHKNFRQNQWKIISSIINEKRDNCAIMATGYGKSLCYQFPPVFLKLITVVVSPLISLMEDQVLSLQLLNIKACLLGTAQKDKTILNKVMNFEYNLVYLTPEFITSDIGSQLLKTLSKKLCLIAIDEAHCISKWGHDFRKCFLNLGCIRKILPEVPILAITATATEKVRNDIITSLHLRNPQIVCTGFDRPNLEFNVRCKSNDIWNDIGPFLQLEKTGSVIVYCLTRNSTEEITSIIRKHGFICESYHAGMSINHRKEIHRKFVRDEIQIIAATIAFGMGIDKPDVRMVIHYGVCQDIESYYQEVGRAGRDGMPAKCILFYNTKDFEFHKFMREKTEYSKQVLKNLENLSEKMYDFISTTDCRRLFILQYFEGNNVKSSKHIKNCCDNCKSNITRKKTSSLVKYKNMDENGFYDFTTDSELLLKAIDVFGGYSGLQIPIMFLRGSKDKKVSQKYYSHTLYGAGKNKSMEWWKNVADLLILNKYIEKRRQNSKYSKTTYFSFTVCLSSKSYSWLQNSNKSPIKLKLPKHMLHFLEPEIQQAQQISSTKNSKCLLSEFQMKPNKMKNDQELLKLLYKVRTSLASELDVMPYMIVTNRALHQLSEKRPKDLKDLKNQQIDGFSEIKINEFGPYFIKCILEYENRLPINSNSNDKNTLNNPVIKSPMKSIKEWLEIYPLPATMKINETCSKIYDLWKNGKNLTEISELMNISESMILNYINELMKWGYCITKDDLRRLNIVDNDFNIISSQIQSLSDLKNSNIDDLQKSCPLHITKDMIKLVLTYYCVRNHIKSLKVDFIDPDCSNTIQIHSFYTNNIETIKNNCDNELNDATSSSSSSLIHLEKDYKKLNEKQNDNENRNDDNDYWESDIEIDYEKIDVEIKKANDSILSLGNHNDCNDTDSMVEIQNEYNNLNENNSVRKITKEINDYENLNDKIIDEKENEQEKKIDNDSKSSSVKRKITYQFNQNRIVYENSSDDSSDDDKNINTKDNVKKRNIPSWMSSSSSVSSSVGVKRKSTKKLHMKNLFS